MGGDLREGKATHTVLTLLLEQGGHEVRDIVARRAARQGDVERVAELATASGAADATRREIAAQAGEAVKALEAFAPSPAREALVDLALREVARLR